jgi:hypothetical protein
MNGMLFSLTSPIHQLKMVTDSTIAQRLRYYQAYMDFFEASLKHDGISHTLEEFLFSPSANVGVKEGLFDEDAPQPHMLARFFSGVVHPVIHTGYGLEFGLPGMLAEGGHIPSLVPLTSSSILTRLSRTCSNRRPPRRYPPSGTRLPL